MSHHNGVLKKISYGFFGIGVALVLMSTLAVVPWVLFPFILGKVLIIHIGIACILIGGALHAANERTLPRPSLLVMVMACFVAVMIASAFMSIDPSKSFWGTDDRGSGVLLWIEMLIALYSMTIVVRSSPLRKKLMGGVVALGVIAAVPALVDVVLHGQHRIDSLFGNPILAGNFLLFPFFFATAAFFSEQSKALRRVALGSAFLILGAMYFTETRGVLLGLAAGIGVGALVWAIRRRDKKLNRILLITLGVLIVVGFALSTVAETHFAKVHFSALSRLATINLHETSATQRILIWRTALRAAVVHPVLGWGPETFDSAFDRFYDPALTKYGFTQTWVDRSHNMWLDALVMEGCLGFVAFAAFLVVPLIGAIRQTKTHREALCFVAALVAYMVQGLTAFDGPATTVMLLALIAMVGSYREVKEFSMPGVLRTLAVFALSVGAVVLIGVVYTIMITSNAMLTFETGGLGTDESLRVAHAGLDTPSPYQLSMRQRFANIVFERANNVPVQDAAKLTQAAIDEMKKGIVAHPQNFSYQFTLGNLLTKAAFRFDPSFGDEANKVFAAAAPFSPTRQALYVQRANIAILQKKYDEAVTLLTYALSLDPSVAQMSFQLGLAETYTPDRIAGLERIQAAAKSPTYPYFADDTPTITHIARIALEEKRYDIAAVVFVHACELNYDDMTAWDNLDAALSFPGYDKEYIRKLVVKQILEIKAISPAGRARANRVVRFIDADKR